MDVCRVDNVKMIVSPITTTDILWWNWILSAVSQKSGLSRGFSAVTYITSRVVFVVAVEKYQYLCLHHRQNRYFNDSSSYSRRRATVFYKYQRAFNTAFAFSLVKYTWMACRNASHRRWPVKGHYAYMLSAQNVSHIHRCNWLSCKTWWIIRYV